MVGSFVQSPGIRPARDPTHFRYTDSPAALGVFLFGQGRQFLQDFFEPATALSIGMNGKRFRIGDFCVGFIQILQRGNFASQALNSIQNVSGIHAYSIRLIFGPRCEWPGWSAFVPVSMRRPGLFETRRFALVEGRSKPCLSEGDAK